MKCPIRNKIEVNLAVVKLKHEKGRGKKRKGKNKRRESSFMGREREVPVLCRIWEGSGRKGACYLAKYV